MRVDIDIEPVLSEWLDEGKPYQRAFDRDIQTAIADVIRRWMPRAVSPYVTIPCRDCGEVHSELGNNGWKSCK